MLYRSNRLTQINIKVTEALKDEIKKAAKRQGLGMSGFIRMVCWDWIRTHAEKEDMTDKSIRPDN